MVVIGRDKLTSFWESGHADSRGPLQAWLSEVDSAEWKTPADVKRRYRRASILKGNRVRFEIKGNTYRLIVVVDYQRQAVTIRWVGTHAEYDKIDAGTV